MTICPNCGKALTFKGMGVRKNIAPAVMAALPAVEGIAKSEAGTQLLGEKGAGGVIAKAGEAALGKESGVGGVLGAYGKVASTGGKAAERIGGALAEKVAKKIEGNPDVKDAMVESAHRLWEYFMKFNKSKAKSEYNTFQTLSGLLGDEEYLQWYQQHPDEARMIVYASSRFGLGGFKKNPPKWTCKRIEKYMKGNPEALRLSEQLLPHVVHLIHAKQSGNEAAKKAAEKAINKMAGKKVIPRGFTEAEMKDPSLLARRISCISQVKGKKRKGEMRQRVGEFAVCRAKVNPPTEDKIVKVEVQRAEGKIGRDDFNKHTFKTMGEAEQYLAGTEKPESGMGYYKHDAWFTYSDGSVYKIQYYHGHGEPRLGEQLKGHIEYMKKFSKRTNPPTFKIFKCSGCGKTFKEGA